MNIKKRSSKWISVYIFHNTSFEELLTGLLKEIIDGLESKSLISSFFFVRYWENGPHVRLRMLPKQFGNQRPIAKYLSSNVRAYFEKLGSKCKYSLEFRDYNPEIERYGNDHLMEIAERQFHMSSRATLQIIYDHLKTWDHGRAMRFAIQMHVYLSKHLFSTKEEEIIFFKKISEIWLVYARGIEGKVENITGANVVRLLQTFETTYGNQKDSINSLISSPSDNNQFLIHWQKDCKTIADSYRVNTPDNSFLVYSSLVHMTNNRLGIHITDEAFLAFAIYRGLEEINRKN